MVLTATCRIHLEAGSLPFELNSFWLVGGDLTPFCDRFGSSVGFEVAAVKNLRLFLGGEESWETAGGTTFVQSEVTRAIYALSSFRNLQCVRKDWVRSCNKGDTNKELHASVRKLIDEIFGDKASEFALETPDWRTPMVSLPRRCPGLR